MISCPLCSKTFPSRTNMVIHMASHTKERPYKCLICSAAFGQASTLSSHVKHVHEGNKQVHKTKECPLCSHKLPSYRFKNHLRTHSAQLPISCTIFGCEFKTKHKKTLQQHFRSDHYDERPYECPTKGCNYKCKRKDSLSEHLRTHSNEKPFSRQVPGCNFTGKSKASVTEHTKGFHGTGKLWKCSTCDFRTHHTSSFNKHKDVHGNIKQFKCQAPNCGYASHQRNGLRVHFDRRHRKKDILCTALGCKFRCGSTTVLKLHLRHHELPILQCPSDSCTFKSRYTKSLIQHVSRLHEDFEPASVVRQRIFDLQVSGTANALDTLHCPFPNCAYQTNFPHHYNRHRSSHNEKQKHVCKFCFSRFTDSYCLKKHIPIHLGEKPYSCLLCNYATDCSEQLRAHAGRMHNAHVIPRGKENDVRVCRTCNANCSSYSELVLHSLSHLRAVVVLERLDANVM